MNGERNKLIWGETVARVWREPAYKEELLANPKQVLTSAGMSFPEAAEISILSNTETEKYLILPHDKSFEEVESSFTSYLKSLLPLGDGVKVIIQQSTDNIRYLALPEPPRGASGQVLTEDELDLVAGGDSTATSTNSVQTVEAVTTEVEATETTTTTTVEAEAEVALVVVLI